MKGRGEHRGKYLEQRYLRRKGTVTRWVRQQQKATRYDRSLYTARIRDDVNGYLVTLIAPTTVTARVDELKAFIQAHAAPNDRPNCYWFRAAFHTPSDDFCWDCALEVAMGKGLSEEDAAREVDGGWDIEHDSPPFCEGCGVKLSGALTESGADEELAALTAHAAFKLDNAEGWASLRDALEDVDDDDPRWRRIARIVDRARAAEQRRIICQAALAAAPGMPAARSTFLGLLASRALQKAPDPSFPLWNELLAWRALPYETRDADPEANALERCMIKAAKPFARSLGFDAYWSGGLFMIKAPYGTYHWPFVVLIEQYRLWRPKAFEEGRSYIEHPCPSGDPSWPHHRDANPYPDGTIEHQQWDCGYIGCAP
jgi:hypothetical protein